MAGEGYRRQIGVGAPAGLPQADAGDFGAGIGAALERAGAMGHESEIRAYQIQRRFDADQQSADFAKRFAQSRLALGEARIAARANAGPGAAGHEKAMADRFDEATKGLLDGIAEDSVRRDADAQLQGYRASFLEGEAGFEYAKRSAKVVTDVRDLKALTSAEVRVGGDYADVGRHWDQAIDALQNVDSETKEQLRREGHADQAMAHIGWGIDNNPEGARTAILSGVYNGELDGQQLDRALAQADAAIRQRAAAAQAETAAARSVAKDELAAQEDFLNSGGGGLADRQSISEKFAGWGDKSKAAEWARKAKEFAAVQGAKGWKLPQMDARIVELEAKSDRSAAEAAELNGLKDQRSSSATRLNQSGGALLQYSYATGKPLPPLDPNDPSSMSRRGALARAAAREHSRFVVEPITEGELPMFRDLVQAGGPAGKQQALEMLRGFGDAATIVGAARQMSGEGDGDFRIASRLMLQPGGSQVARDILRGTDVINANPNVWTDKIDKAAKQNYGQWYGPLLRDLPADYQADIFDAAKKYYATRFAGSDKYDPGNFALAIEVMMGRSRDGAGNQRGGVAHLPQGLVIVPPTMSPDAFAKRLARGTPAQYRAAAGGRRPRAPDGGDISERDFKALAPVMLGNGRYGFKFPSGRYILDDTGNPYSVDVGALPGMTVPR